MSQTKMERLIYFEMKSAFLQVNGFFGIPFAEPPVRFEASLL